MRKLGKKNHEMTETIEAYCSCACSGCTNCTCSCAGPGGQAVTNAISSTASSASLNGVDLGRTTTLSGL